MISRGLLGNNRSPRVLKNSESSSHRLAPQSLLELVIFVSFYSIPVPPNVDSVSFVEYFFNAKKTRQAKTVNIRREKTSLTKI